MEFKGNKRCERYVASGVLIESDWNLKDAAGTSTYSQNNVLIESDWNLKDSYLYELLWFIDGINRIRLEFKGKPERDYIFILG